MGACFSKGRGVTQYTEGFKEHAYRLLFPYEDNFPDKEPHLLTILPTGVIETTKTLTSEKERGLIAYTFGQQIEKKLLEGKVVEAEASDWKGKKHADTPFIKDILGPKYTLIQTWPTKINEKFKQDFKMTDFNPDPKKFEAGAVTDWKATIQALSGEDATDKVKIQYCHKTTNNDFSCYLGVTEDLLLYFKENNEAMIAVGIKEMTRTGFVATGEDGKGTKIEKTFTMDPKTQYVVYKKVGWETMGCCKTKEQFDKECEFRGKGEWKMVGQPKA